MYFTDLKGAKHADSITVPLRRWLAAIHPNFTQFSGIYFGLAVTQTHSSSTALISKQSCVMFTELDTNTDTKKTGKLSTVQKSEQVR